MLLQLDMSCLFTIPGKSDLFLKENGGGMEGVVGKEYGGGRVYGGGVHSRRGNCNWDEIHETIN